MTTFTKPDQLRAIMEPAHDVIEAFARLGRVTRALQVQYLNLVVMANDWQIRFPEIRHDVGSYTAKPGPGGRKKRRRRAARG